MSTTVLPELAAESVATAERLGRLSAETGLDPAEAEYILASGLAAIQRLPRLWPIIRGRIGAGMPGAMAHEHLARLLDAVDKNLTLAGTLKESADDVRKEVKRVPEAIAELAAAEKRLQEIRAEAVGLLKVIEVPARWPTEEQLSDARERMGRGGRMTAEEFRQAQLDE
jgi:hypothetical protein